MKVDGGLCTLSLAKHIADIEGINYSAGEDDLEDSANAVPFGSCKGTGCVCATANGRFKTWGGLVLFIVLTLQHFCSERVCQDLQTSSRYELVQHNVYWMVGKLQVALLPASHLIRNICRGDGCPKRYAPFIAPSIHHWIENM